MNKIVSAGGRWLVLSMASFFLLLATTSASAIPLIQDAFDYSPGILDGSNGGTGWAGPWSISQSAGLTEGSIEVLAGSLVFSDYETAGNRVNLEAVSASGFAGLQGVRAVGQSVTSGELWASFLYRRTDDQVGISTISRTNEVRFNSPAIHFGMKAKGPSSQGIKVRYDTSDSPSAASTSVQDGDTYLMVGRFTNLGSTDGSGVGTMWALTESDYNSIKFGGVTSGELDNAATLIATDDDVIGGMNSARTLEIGDELWMLNYTSAFSSSYDLDELRYGTSLADVVPGSSAVQILGDYNGNGLVDAADYTVWRDTLDSTTNLAADGNDNGTIDAPDYGVWTSSFGNSSATASGVSVPEPSSLALVVAVVNFMLIRRHRS